jgi:outer membrane protein assembly factor BamB
MKKERMIYFWFLTLSVSVSAQDNIQWRGTDRTGLYKETGLLKSWPDGGPTLLWHYDQLGEGHSSIAVANDKIYITGLVDGSGHVFVFDTNGKLLNKKTYGQEWDANYNGSRGTITPDNGKLYVYSGTGNLVCLRENDLNILWKKNITDDFQGSNIRWGVNESPLIVDEKVIITPGGKENNVVALNKNTGELIWSCAGEGDMPAYCSPLYVGHQQIPQIITITDKHILGIDAANGKKLWSYPYNNNRNIHPNTPIYHDNQLLCLSGYNKGSILLRLTDGGRKVEKVWENPEFDPKTGGAVKIGNYVYGSGDHNKYWFCIDWQTGETKYKDNPIAVGAVISADGLLFCYSDKGEMALMKPTPEKFDLISRYPITLGAEQHWAHPVIYKGVMYVRHGNTLMAYHIAE